MPGMIFFLDDGSTHSGRETPCAALIWRNCRWTDELGVACHAEVVLAILKTSAGCATLEVKNGNDQKTCEAS